MRCIFADYWHVTKFMKWMTASIAICMNVYSEGQTTFRSATQTGIPLGTFEIVIQEVLWLIRGSYSAIWSLRLTNVKWHSDPWPTVRVTSQPMWLSTNFMTLIPSLTFTELWVVFHWAFATSVACQQGTVTLPDIWFRPPSWDVLVLQLLRPDS